MENNTLKFLDYDCIGFDLDHTLAHFRIGPLVELEYQVLSDFLINKGYSSQHLRKPIDYDFLLKGLVLDTHKGNILKIAEDGKILSATHGTRLLTSEDIQNLYPSFHWELTDLFINNPLEIWSGPNLEKIRVSLDYFDTVVTLIFARIIDAIDEKEDKLLQKYTAYSDILKGLYDMGETYQFAMNKGGFYPAFKTNPDKYYHKCSDKLLEWLKSLKKSGKIVFLLTGSYSDFASLTASYTMGPNWRDYFDIVITYARKPSFFVHKNEFLGVENFKELDAVPPEQLQLGGMYSRGNWDGLHKFLSKHSCKTNPKCLYIGDNMIQDVYSPIAYSQCDVVSVCGELCTKENADTYHLDHNVVASAFWGSYLHHEAVDTIWHKMLKQYAKIVIPSMEFVGRQPLDYCYQPWN